MVPYILLVRMKLKEERIEISVDLYTYIKPSWTDCSNESLSAMPWGGGAVCKYARM